MNSLVLCGGTGAHVGVAFLRLHTLGSALGFFRHGDAALDLPFFFAVDQDLGDGGDSRQTAWQLLRFLLEQHPSRHRLRVAPAGAVPGVVAVAPLPVGPEGHWSRQPNNRLAQRYAQSPLLPLAASERQQQIDYSRGMMGSPAVGALLFRLKQFDQKEPQVNHDRHFQALVNLSGRVVVVGSGAGGTGASVGPTLSEQLAAADDRHVMSVMVLDWFELEIEGSDAEIRTRAQRRNRELRENASSALEYYGRRLARDTAIVPVGVPRRAIAKRRFTGDAGQPVHEAYVHAVGALCGFRQLTAASPYSHGLYAMGAVDAAALSAGTAIPGGTLQGLANQAATLRDTLAAAEQTLRADHTGQRLMPALVEAVQRRAHPERPTAGFPAQVADQLAAIRTHYESQLRWLAETLGIAGQSRAALFTLERRIRERLAKVELLGETTPPPERLATALFDWTAAWIGSEASTDNGLQTIPAAVASAHWPDLRNVDRLGISISRNGDLEPIRQEVLEGVVDAFVDQVRISCNGWPQPLAAVDFFRRGILRHDPRSLRQLEILLLGLATGHLRAQPLAEEGLAPSMEPTLEQVLAATRRAGQPGLATLRLVWGKDGRERVVAVNAPHTLLCPVPDLFETDADAIWSALWSEVSNHADGDWDKASWSTTRDPLALRQVCAWLSQQETTFRGQGAAPPWAEAFRGERATLQWSAFTVGEATTAYWGPADATNRPLVKLTLPAAPPAAGARQAEAARVRPGAESLSQSELLAATPALAAQLLETRDDRNGMYQRVEFVAPGRPEVLYGWWEEHLDLLQRRGLILAKSVDEAGEIALQTRQGNAIHWTQLPDSRLLSRERIAVKSVVPIQQIPVPKLAAKATLLPDLPIQSQYLDLVLDTTGERLLERLKRGEREIAVAPVQHRRDASGGRLAGWDVPLRGRPTPLLIEVLEEKEGTRAHWMIWPNLRSEEPAGWKIYYFYEASNNLYFTPELLWLNAAGEVHRRSRPPGASNPFAHVYPLAFENGTHTGGPPLAIVGRLRQQEAGVYLVPLRRRQMMNAAVALAVDFGTSHSVAAAAVSGEIPKVIHLGPELAHPESSLTLHISQDWGHAGPDGPSGALGPTGGGTWVPTYALSAAQAEDGVLPSELLFPHREIDEVNPASGNNWLPLVDYTIPGYLLGRTDLAEHIIADFKWRSSQRRFKGSEQILREKYLQHFLELVLAELVATSGFPREIATTFTYPLRESEVQVETYKMLTAWLLQRAQAATGIRLSQLGGVGIYDESRAARLPKGTAGEVCLVADLGGGTLDLLVAGLDDKLEQRPEVVDSVQIGGNLFLGHAAEGGDASYLPVNDSWGATAADKLARLRGWIRAIGAHSLFGAESQGSTSPQGMRGFSAAHEGNLGRHLIDRYFALIVDYMARSLAAYLLVHWYSHVPRSEHSRLRISVQLRGNGWKLRYQNQDHVARTWAVQNIVRRRVNALLEKIPNRSFDLPADVNWADPAKYSVTVSPKVDTVLRAVGKQMSYAEVKERWRRHTLVDLELLHPQKKRIPWFAALPIELDPGALQIDEIAPPIDVSASGFDSGPAPIEIRELEAGLVGPLNSALRSQAILTDGGFVGPVAPMVWEAVFDAKKYRP